MPERLNFKKVIFTFASTLRSFTSYFYSVFRVQRKVESCKVSEFVVEGTPVPIPNTVVKLNYADNTWLEAAREDRSSLTFIFLLSSVGRAHDC